MLIKKDGNLMNKNQISQYDSIVFYGASMRNKKVIDKYGIRDKVRYVVDSNEQLAGGYIDGYEIYTKNILEKEKATLILTVLERCAEEIIEAVNQYSNCDLAFYISGECDLEITKRENKKVIEHIIQKKYIHLFPDEKFLMPFYTMLEDCFNISDHFFIVDYARIDLMENQYKNFEYACKKNNVNNNILFMKDFGNLQNIINDENNCNDIFGTERMFDLFKKAEKIVLHSVAFSNNFLKFLHSMIKSGCGEKMIWICWGGDIYFEENSFVAKEILEKINYGSAAKYRIDKILQKCQIRMIETKVPRYAYIPYKIKKDGKIESDKEKNINILLGHYAAEDNNLEHGLEVMHKFRDKNIKIYCTLSYGFEDYREEIIKKGRELFGEKFIPIIDYMDLDRYWKFLETIDVAIYPMIRFAAATTLSYLNLLGKKIYMKKEMQAICLDKGIYVNDIEKVKRQGWEEFIKSDTKKRDDSLERLNDKIVSYWKTIL